MEIDLDELERVLAPDFTAELSSWTQQKLRDRRREVEGLESIVSYARRIVQGRIDLYAAELTEREAGPIQRCLEGVEQTLSGQLSVQSSRIAHLDVSVDVPCAAEVSKLAGVDIEAYTQDRKHASELLGQLRAAEVRLSKERRGLHRIIDDLRSEVVRRYRSGNLKVDDILGSDLEQQNLI